LFIFSTRVQVYDNLPEDHPVNSGCGREAGPKFIVSEGGILERMSDLPGAIESSIYGKVVDFIQEPFQV
jgi:hypothetical protein